ncbi:PadR family transcriptional regulator [Amycolatopsis sp., V23-08]|uniref:PadR family transcriptional regulator n=1 Tax=Amycolatopsis heterodermiae TaxID=3110235 RepID=A0ABU5RPK7_9PSEU|nr:PadR family transcriptional regulator [Amycolatopsis sp., V23-08]MEA5367690.1 PadR family transcriptional regulator [Amycolatopsis sp., V23-08]
MGSVRLFILGALARGGPMHGHQIRRAAQVDRTELWADVKPGSLYAALRRMADEGVIEALRTERVGNMPERTVYTITDEGRRELSVLRHTILTTTKLRPDPVDLALAYTEDLDEPALRALIEDRRAALVADLASWKHLQEHAAPYLDGLEPLGFDHVIIRLEAEVTWHDRVLDKLTDLLANRGERT